MRKLPSLWLIGLSASLGALVPSAVKRWNLTKSSAVGFATPAVGLTTDRTVTLPLPKMVGGEKKDAESPAASFDTFDFHTGDYAMIRWSDGGLEICRVWDWRMHDELEKLIPNITARQARPLVLERISRDHPLADVARRLITG